MINAKTVMGFTLLLISAVEFLTIKDLYHLGKMNSLLITIGVAFLLTILSAAYLIVKGIRGVGKNSY